MAAKQAKEYRLSPAAQRDLEGIWDYTVSVWSVDQAERYLQGLSETLELLCLSPRIARERTEFDPPVRLYPYRSHLIIYRIEDDYLHIIRVFHNRQHWQAFLEGEG